MKKMSTVCFLARTLYVFTLVIYREKAIVLRILIFLNVLGVLYWIALLENCTAWPSLILVLFNYDVQGNKTRLFDNENKVSVMF